MDADDIDSKSDERMKQSITLQLLECLPKLIGSGIFLSDDGEACSVLCRPCNTCITNSNRTKLSHLQQHLNGKNHRKQVTNTLTNFQNWTVQKKWEKVSLDANGFLMFECETSGITLDKQPVESITEEQKEISVENTSSVVSVNLSEIFYANTILPLKIGYLCHACATILNPMTTWEIIVSHLKNTQHTEKLLKWNVTRMRANFLDIPTHLTPLFSENFLQQKEKEIYCIACSAHLQTVESLIFHTSSKNHTKKLDLFMQRISTVTILNLEKDLTSKDFQSTVSAAASSTLSPKSVETRKSTDLNPKLMLTSDELISLQRNHYIIGEKLHCKICSVELYSSGNILSHINGKNHLTQLREFKAKQQEELAKPPKKSLKPQAKDVISDQSNPRMMIPDALKPLISQHLLQHFEKEIYCAACSAHLQNAESLINHTNGKKHMAQLDLFMHTISMATILNLEVNSTSKDFQPSLSDAANSRLSLESAKPLESNDFKPKLVQTSDELDLLERNQYIIGENLHCKICRVDLDNSPNILPHIKGKKHNTWLLEFKVMLQEKLAKPPKKSLTPPAKDVISDQSNPRMIIPDALNTLSPKSVETLKSTDSNPKFMLRSDELISLQRNHYIIGEKLHCQICSVDLQSSGNILSHINGKNHLTQLREFQSKQQEKLAKPPKKSLKPQAKDVISDQSNPRMMIPDALKPLISQHLLQRFEKEIYCAACSAHLQNVESLINHTNGKKHMAKLNLFMHTISMATILNLEVNSTSKDFQPSLSDAASSTLSLENVKPRESNDFKPKLVQTSDELGLLERNQSIIGEDLHCKICRVDLDNSPNILSHIKGKKHNTRLLEFKVMLQENLAKPPNKSNKTKATEASTDTCNKYLTASKNNENFFPQSIEHHNIDMNPIIKPMNTERDQKCLQQKRSLLDTPISSVNNNIHAKVPLSTSPPFIIATCTSPTFALISTSKATTSTASLSNSSIKDSISDQPNLMKIPDELKPLISKHLETEIYCDTCSAHLQSAQSLVEHTKSKHHKINLNRKNKDEKLKSKLKMIVEKLRQPKCLTSNDSLADANTHPKQTNLHKDSRKAESNYLTIDINEIYKVNPEKLRVIEMSCQLCFPKSPESLYCLICQKSTLNNVQNFYEHMFSDSHCQYFADLEANDLLYVDYPNEYSNLKLLKDFIMELTDETLQCIICDELILNLDAEILAHIKQEKHIIQKRRLNKVSEEKLLKTVLQSTQSYHDNINIYSCELCDFSSDSAFAFAKHSTDPTDNACLEQRSLDECNHIYDSCVPCASLWLGFMHTYPRHCTKKSHKNNVLDYQIIKEVTLPREARNYLKHAVQNVEDLIQLSDQVVTKEGCKVSELLECLEKTVEPVFPQAKAYPFGSRMSGLGFPESDIDVFLDCGTYFRTTTSEKDEERIIKTVTCRLHGNKKSWKIEEVLIGGRIPIIKLYHQCTELRCDISFKNGLSVENTKLLKCFVNNCPMVRRLILFLKKWLAICKLSGSQYITNYALCWYVIFYLQSKTILPSVADLIRQENKSKLVAGWETGICEKFVPRLHDDTFLSLLQGFFKYYAIFNFRNCVACPLVGYTVDKNDFEDLSSLPPEMAPYIDHLRVTMDHTQLFRIDSPMCIQDPYDLAHNLTKAVSKLDLAIFKEFCEASAEVLNSDFKMP